MHWVWFAATAAAIAVGAGVLFRAITLQQAGRRKRSISSSSFINPGSSFVNPFSSFMSPDSSFMKTDSSSGSSEAAGGWLGLGIEGWNHLPWQNLGDIVITGWSLSY